MKFGLVYGAFRDSSIKISRYRLRFSPLFLIEKQTQFFLVFFYCSF